MYTPQAKPTSANGSLTSFTPFTPQVKTIRLIKITHLITGRLDIKTAAQSGGKTVTRTQRSPLHPRKYSWYIFLAELGPQPRSEENYINKNFQLQIGN